jgi:hypothetical protein
MLTGRFLCYVYKVCVFLLQIYQAYFHHYMYIQAVEKLDGLEFNGQPQKEQRD